MLWQKVEKLPTLHAESLILAKTADSRMMMFHRNILQGAMSEKTPKHLQFPATHFITKKALEALTEE